MTNNDQAIIKLKRDDENPIEGRTYCKKHGCDITIIQCQGCSDDLSKALSDLKQNKKEEGEE